MKITIYELSSGTVRTEVSFAVQSAAQLKAYAEVLKILITLMAAMEKATKL